MEYYCPISDSNNYIHSIDNLIIEYDIKDIGQNGMNHVIDNIHAIKEKNKPVNYYERLNVNASFRYQWYHDHFHIENGIYVSVGKYIEKINDKKELFIYPMVKLEVNPNKHFDKPVLTDLLEYLQSVTSEARIIRYDYAIDIPVVPDDVQVFGSRKEHGLYKGTRYYGQRNKNGFCRIYDKAKEQESDNPLTRVEHTFSTVKATKNISFENIFIKDMSLLDNDKISSSLKCIGDLCLLLQKLGVSYDNELQQLNFRTKKQILEYIAGTGYTKLEFNQEIHDKLLNNISDVFKIKQIVTVDDDNEFLSIADDYKNPWED